MVAGLSGFSKFKHRKGAVTNVHKFGSNPGLNNSTLETVWSAGGLYPWDEFATAQTLYVSSTVAGDNGSVEIQGLDANYNLLTETVSINGDPSQNTTTNTFIRVFRLQYTDTNAGLITARTVSHAGTVVGQIDIGKAQSLMAIYTIPAGYVGYLMNYTLGTGKNDDATLEVYFREFGKNFRIKNEGQVFQNSFIQQFPAPLEITEKGDIDMRAITTNSGGGSCFLNFDLVVYKWDR